ncbi:MAG: 23S rRNA (pseudouridine(1915)-N(3))-methyltransferase RlmH [Firmicutes bacterium]|nr:23S rRNA (pseudouridine(1915)-N(3))-methyltransferase RlmH [Bacillota bacterium]
MKITILCVGKIKEKFYKDALAEYAKRLLAYTNFDVIEVADEKTAEGEEALILEKEGARILGKLPEHAYVVALCIEGKQKDSVEMSKWMENLMNHGNSHIVFIIGGSCGLSPKVVARADEKLSFSKLTFPHQLMRVILAEQVYRCFRIMKGEPYHK